MGIRTVAEPDERAAFTDALMSIAREDLRLIAGIPTTCRPTARPTTMFARRTADSNGSRPAAARDTGSRCRADGA
jgi:hypothetical protein